MIACGEGHTLVLSMSGLVYACGDNSKGQLGDSTRESSSHLKLIDEIAHLPMRFVEAGSFSASISEEGSNLFLWGTGSFGEFLTPHRVKKIRGETVEVSLGSGFGVALSVHGFLYSWGDNCNGELGQGDYILRSTPQLMGQLDTKRVTTIACGDNFVIALGQTMKAGADKEDIGNGLSLKNDEDGGGAPASGSFKTTRRTSREREKAGGITSGTSSTGKMRKSKSTGMQQSSRRFKKDS